MQNFKGFINVIKQEMIIQLVRLNFFLKKKNQQSRIWFQYNTFKRLWQKLLSRRKKNPSYSKRHPKEIVVNNVVTI